MKKVIIIVAILVAVVVAGGVIASILLQPDEIRISGAYSAEALGTGKSLSFDKEGGVIGTYRSAGMEVYSVAGTYEINDGKIVMSFDDESIAINVFEGQFTFELGEDYILIDGLKYYKTE